MRSLTVILGCLTVAATCPAQPPNWVQVQTTNSPPARGELATAHDIARGRTVLFGGHTSSGFLNDTWEFDGKNWTKMNPSTSPPSRWLHRMVFDLARQNTVVFGGRIGFSGLSDETWTWDGRNWTQRKPTKSPSPRFLPAMAYDSLRQRTVLFGGSIRSGYANDTWEWDGVSWTQITTQNAPSLRYSTMVYDSSRRRIVLKGGYGGTYLTDTWEYDGVDWTQITTSSAPSARCCIALAYDSARQRTVLFGGGGVGGTFLSDTWEYDGRNWTLVNPVTRPSVRTGNDSMVFDSVRQRMVLFGGTTGRGSFAADTWEYRPSTLTLTADTPTISIVNGGTQNLTLNAGTDLKSKSYWIFGSATSTMPGIVLTGIHIPLVADIYTTIALGAVNTTVFTKFMGPLSATGTATASLIVPKMLSIPTGFKLYHAYVVFDGTTGQIFTSSNPVSVEFK